MRRPGHAVGVRPRRNRHRIGLHQHPCEIRVLVAQHQVGELVVQQRVLAAGGGVGYAVQHHRPDPALGRVVIAVGVPADRVIGVRDEFAPRADGGHLDLTDAVVVGEPVAVEPIEAHLMSQQPRNVLVGGDDRADVDDHVRPPDPIHQRLALGRLQGARVVDRDDEVRQPCRTGGELRVAPRPIGGGLVRVERARYRQDRDRGRSGHVTRPSLHVPSSSAGRGSRRAVPPFRDAAFPRPPGPRSRSPATPPSSARPGP